MTSAFAGFTAFAGDWMCSPFCEAGALCTGGGGLIVSQKYRMVFQLECRTLPLAWRMVIPSASTPTTIATLPVNRRLSAEPGA